VKSRVGLILGFVGVFGLGAVAGGAVVAGSHARHQAALMGQAGRGSFAALLVRRLKLRPEQRSAVEAIVGRYDSDRERIVAPVEPAVKARRAAMRQEVRAALDPSQTGEFDALTRELDENRARRAGHGASAAAPASEAPVELGASNR
jgi:hypothetical protein